MLYYLMQDSIFFNTTDIVRSRGRACLGTQVYIHVLYVLEFTVGDERNASLSMIVQ